MLRITFKVIAECALQLEIPDNMTIKSILEILSTELEHPLEYMKLIYNGRRISDYLDTSISHIICIDSKNISNLIIHVVKNQIPIEQEKFAMVVIMKSELEELNETIKNQKIKIEELERILSESSHYN